MVELIAEMIIEIHDTIIQRYGGLPGVLCQGTIDIEKWLRENTVEA